MCFRYVIILVTLFFSTQSFANEFPTGSLKGVGFLVEKGSMKITEKDLHIYESSAKIVKRSQDTYEMTINAHLQKSATSRAKKDKRIDVYKVVWKSKNSGMLINVVQTYKEDKSSFTFTDTHLVIKSWISRHQLWETHTYLLDK